MPNNKNHLPIFGVGPFYVATIFILTTIGLTLNYLNLINSGRFEMLKIPFIVVGIIILLLGILMWVMAVFKSEIDKSILNNKLATTGIYALSRNPIYAAFILINLAIILFTYNLYLLVLPIIYYLFLGILIINTEEKWCINKFGDEYLDYMKKTNRIIPIPRYKKNPRN